MQRCTPRVAPVERRRILPPLAERELDVVDCRPAHLELDVVPRRTVAVVLVVELDRLRITAVATVVASAVAQVDAADERDVVGGVATADHDDLLVMAPAAAHPVVEEDLTARLVHDAREIAGSPPRRTSPASGANARASRARARRAVASAAEHVADVGAVAVEQLVGVALPVGEVAPCRRARRQQSTWCRRRKYETPSTRTCAVVAVGPGDTAACRRSIVGRRVPTLVGARGTIRRGRRPTCQAAPRTSSGSSSVGPGAALDTCFAGSRGAGRPARTASSCAATAAPNSTTIDDSNAQRRSAIDPGERPVRVTERRARLEEQPEPEASRPTRAALPRWTRTPATTTPAGDGCGAHRNSNAIAATVSSSASGQRTTRQTDAPVSSPSTRRSTWPNAKSTNAPARARRRCTRARSHARTSARRPVLLDAVQPVERRARSVPSASCR